MYSSGSSTLYINKDRLKKSGIGFTFYFLPNSFDLEIATKFHN